MRGVHTACFGEIPPKLLAERIRAPSTPPLNQIKQAERQNRQYAQSSSAYAGGNSAVRRIAAAGDSPWHLTRPPTAPPLLDAGTHLNSRSTLHGAGARSDRASTCRRSVKERVMTFRHDHPPIQKAASMGSRCSHPDQPHARARPERAVGAQVDAISTGFDITLENAAAEQAIKNGLVYTARVPIEK
jgi:hypothetical protein